MRTPGLLVSVIALAACGDDASDPCGEPLYGGNATDEAWRVMLDAEDEVQVGAAEAVTITSPAAAAILAAEGPAPTLSWTSPIARADGRRGVGATAAARFEARRPPERSFWDALAGLFVGSARAHLPPITSDVYLLELATPGRECPWRVLTTNEAWVPDAATWAELGDHPGAYTLAITSAYLIENRISEGPFRPSAPAAFEIR
ncbi:MAG: hypothetical protein IT385_03175 [Deltaproteobacteria bacterium]|nr:hypothetical protein [Deltaproteobacteria bacterium]